MLTKRTAVVAMAGLVAACTASPRAQIALITKPADLNHKELDTYAFPKSFVDITRTADAKDVSITVRNASYEKFRVALRHADSVGVKTSINITKLPDTDLVDQAGVSVADNRMKFIEDVGKVATTLISSGLIALAGDTVTFPVSLDTISLLDGVPDSGSAYKRDDLPSWQVSKEIHYWFGPVQPDAVAVSAGGFDGLNSGLVYASCREMMVSFPVVQPAVGGAQPVTITATKSVFVSDPRYFRFVAFPQKGKVQVHSTCGVSVSSDQDAVTSSTAELATAVITQAQAVKKAVDDLKASEKAKEDKAAAAAAAAAAAKAPAGN